MPYTTTILLAIIKDTRFVLGTVIIRSSYRPTRTYTLAISEKRHLQGLCLPCRCDVRCDKGGMITDERERADNWLTRKSYPTRYHPGDRQDVSVPCLPLLLAMPFLAVTWIMLRRSDSRKSTSANSDKPLMRSLSHLCGSASFYTSLTMSVANISSYQESRSLRAIQQVQQGQ